MSSKSVTHKLKSHPDSVRLQKTAKANSHAVLRSYYDNFNASAQLFPFTQSQAVQRYLERGNKRNSNIVVFQAGGGGGSAEQGEEKKQEIVSLGSPGCFSVWPLHTGLRLLARIAS